MDSHNSSKPNTTPGSPNERRLPARTMLLWLVVLLACSALIMARSVPNGAADAQVFTQSRFEQELCNGRILSAKITPKSNENIVEIYGKYGEPPKANALNSDKGYTVQVVYTERLDSLINQHCKSVIIEENDHFWYGILSTILPILFTVGLLIFFTRRMFQGGGAGGMMSFGKSKARMVLPGPNAVTLKDVAGIEEAKSEMQEIVDYLKDPLKFRRLGGKIPRGVLMVGPPGTGKTLLARAIAGEAGVPFYSVSGSDFDEMFVGVGTSRVRDMFEEGKRHAPCLIFIDELDAIGRSRYGLNEAGHAHEQTLNSLLVEMDGFEANSGVIVLAATNRPDVLDKALLRPGRFDRQITIDLPDLRGRMGILKIHADKVCMDPSVDLRVIARGTAGFSGADLANLINEAALLATRTGKDAVTLDALEEARDKVCWGKERRSRRISDKERKLIAYHEGGHALVNMLCENSTPLHKITIIPRGIAYLGATMQLPEQDTYTIAYSELNDSIAVSMGGRVAEKIIFNELSSGATADIRQATDTARKMVCVYGMSDKMGPLNYANSDGVNFLGRNIGNGENFSEETTREIDMEIRRIVAAAEQRVVDMLTENKAKLIALAEALLERETMTAEEAYAVIGLPMPEGKAQPDDLEDERPAAAAAEAPLASAPEATEAPSDAETPQN